MLVVLVNLDIGQKIEHLTIIGIVTNERPQIHIWLKIWNLIKKSKFLTKIKLSTENKNFGWWLKIPVRKAISGFSLFSILYSSVFNYRNMQVYALKPFGVKNMFVVKYG